MMFTTESVSKRISDMYNNEYELISEYNGVGKPITLRHKCGNEYTISKANLFLNDNGGLCLLCHKKKVKSRRNWKNITEDELSEMIKKEDPEYMYISGYNHSYNGKVKLKHISCNYEYEVSLKMFLGTKKRRCPNKNCINKNKRGHHFIKDNYLESIIEEEYEWLSEYNNDNKEKLSIRHKECGHEYEVRPNDFQQGYRCPKCSPTFSKKEEEIYEFISSIYDGPIEKNKKFKYDITNNRKSHELDIYLPDKNIGIEFNGYYWHSDKFKDKNFHLDKQNTFRDKGITVFNIDENDYDNKPDIIKIKIKHLLGLNDTESIYARKCKFEKVTDYDLKEFMNKNHIQGHVSSSLQYALKYNDEIIAAMTFSKNRINVNSKKENEIELLRYATDINYRIPGGFSKLLKNSVSDIKLSYPIVDTIKTFADKNLSEAKVYYKNDFVLSHESSPSYHYIYRDKKYNRFAFRKSELKKKFPDYYKDSKSETEITNSIPGLYRVWNCGNYILLYNI